MMNTIRPAKEIHLILATAVLLAGMATARARVWQTAQQNATNQSAPAGSASASFAWSGDGSNGFTIQSIEPTGEKRQASEVAWLGLGVEESPEALSSQLGLKPGEGLTVNLVASDSPAAKAGFQKHDVLAELDGQMLVDQKQLRKLVQMRAVGDTVKLAYYRGGKNMTASVKLGKKDADWKFDMGSDSLPGDMKNLKIQLGNLKGQLRGMDGSLARAGVDKARINEEVQRAMEEARRSLEDAARVTAKEGRDMNQAYRDFQSVYRGGVDVANNATVTVRNSSNADKTIVRTDEAGTIIIEAGAKTHLTARGKDGKILFDGDISTKEEQKQVPKEVWAKAKPMYEQLH